VLLLRGLSFWESQPPMGLPENLTSHPEKQAARRRRRPVRRPRSRRCLLKGPLAHGYNTNVWTTARIAEVIRREFGVSYHRDHIGRLMHSLNWSHQKPEKRAVERDEEAIERWKRKDWPRVKKTLRGWVPTSSLPTNPDSC